MDNQRAEQIIKASEKIEVQYQDVPVWIENVQGSTADISIIGTNRKITVPLAELEDTGRPISEQNIYGLQ
ncbi:MAG TPA: H-type small acid-soluble spore protein [Oscillospiraceae bacterium]|nr:H-type small acid-soluble spore protein [Oscillospiraceae bacterium]